MLEIIEDRLQSQMGTIVPHINQQIRETWLRNTIGAMSTEVDLIHTPQDNQERMMLIEKLSLKHIKRLSSIGGSDMGILYMDDKNEFYPFRNEDDTPKNTQSVIKSKLCVTQVSPANGNQLRGIYLEPAARKAFLRAFPEELKPRPDLMEIFSATHDNRIPEHPWLTGMPDDIFEKPDGKIIIVDYKVPGQDTEIAHMQSSPPTMYRAQIATYQAILEYHGINVSETYLSPMSTSSFEATPIYLGDITGIIKRCLQIGDEAWDNVLNGNVPAANFSSSGSWQKIDEVSAETQERIDKYVFFKKIENQAKSLASEAKSFIEYSLRESGYDIDRADSKSKIPMINISKSTKTSRDNNAILKDAVAAGIDLDNPKYTITSESTTWNVVRSKSSPDFPYVTNLSDRATELLNDGIEELNESKKVTTQIVKEVTEEKSFDFSGDFSL